MKKKQFSILGMLLMLLVSCEQGGIEDAVRISFKDFRNPIELKGEILPVETLWKPGNIFFSDSVLLVIDNSYGDHFVLIYDKELNQIAEQVPKGIGPNESVVCWNLQMIAGDIWAFDLQTNQMKAYLKDDFLTKSHIAPHNTVTLKQQHISVALLSNKNFVSNNANTNHLLVLYDSVGIKINSRYASYPNFSTVDHNNKQKDLLFENRVVYSEKQKRIVVLYRYTDLMDIYDEDLKLISRVHGPDQFLPVLTPDGSLTRETRRSYNIGRLTSDEIWALYEEGNYIPSSPPWVLYPDKILVFDFSGKPLRSYHLDHRLLSFCVDEVNRIIYGLTELEEYTIVKFHY